MPNASIISGRVFRLYPTTEQAARLHRWAGALRFLWNRFLEAETEHFAKTKTFLWRADLQAIGQRLRHEYDWIADIPSNATLQVAANLDTALRKMIRDRKAGRRCGFPKPKKRFVRECSIYCANNRTYIAPDHDSVMLPKLGSIKMRGSDAPNGRLYAARIWRDGDRWMISFQFQSDVPAPLPVSDTVVAVDLGISRLATIYDGNSFLHVEASQPLRKAQRILSRRQRRLSRRQKGSVRRRVQARRVTSIHRKVRNRRKEAIHQLTHRLTTKAGTIIIEDLNVKGMANGMLAKPCRDAAFGTIFRTLSYKASWRGRKIIKVGRFFPSSQMCSGCGELHREMRKLSRRTLRCDCGVVIDRDDNAAVNLYREGLGNGAGTSPTRGERGDQDHDPVPFTEPRIDLKLSGNSL